MNSKNITIINNTLFLYFRLFFTTLIGLYSSRIVLKFLGVEDFGIYGLVGGLVILFSFLNSSMSSSTQRFIAFEIEQGNKDKIQDVFITSIHIHLFISVIILLLSETLGLWVLNYKLQIPSGRLIAANWVFQFSVFAFVISIMSVPYNAIIIAYEKMKYFAFVSIIESISKLIAVVSLLYTFHSMDKLIIYSLFIFIISLAVRFLYVIYCRNFFSVTKYYFKRDKILFKQMGNFASWGLVGNIAAVGYNQGANILINLFFGVTVNAARAIAYQVNSAISGFVINFQVALNPQIIKSYSSKNYNYMHLLIIQGSKLSYFLLLILALPLIIEMDAILNLWLDIVPEYTSVFCRLILVSALIESLSGPLMIGAQATGNIKFYQLIVGGTLLLNVPITYLLFKLGYEPEYTLYTLITLGFIALALRLILLKKMIGLSLKQYFKVVIVKILLITLISSLIPYLLYKFFDYSLLRVILVFLFSFLIVAISIFHIGITKAERNLILKYIKLKLKR